LGGNRTGDRNIKDESSMLGISPFLYIMISYLSVGGPIIPSIQDKHIKDNLTINNLVE